MKISAIKAILNGEKGNCEAFQSYGKNYRNEKVSDNSFKEYEDYVKSLSEEQHKLHNRFVDEIAERCFEETDNYFVEGFKLGLLIGIETLTEN